MEVSIVMGVPKNSWFIMEIPIQKDDSYFRKPPNPQRLEAVGDTRNAAARQKRGKTI